MMMKHVVCISIFVVSLCGPISLNAVEYEVTPVHLLTKDISWPLRFTNETLISDLETTIATEGSYSSVKLYIKTNSENSGFSHKKTVLLESSKTCGYYNLNGSSHLYFYSSDKIET